MAGADQTRWTVIRDAARGDDAARAEFARRYDPVIRAYFGARWRISPLLRELDDAVQEVYVACFKEEGALGRAEPGRPGGFRAFLYGVVRNVARRAEEKAARSARQPASVELREVVADEEPLSKVFDRAWARSTISQAVRLLARRAHDGGDGAMRRVELLELRLGEGLPIREIARLWDEDPARLHYEFAKARSEFEASLRDVVREHHPRGSLDVEAEFARLADCLRIN